MEDPGAQGAAPAAADVEEKHETVPVVIAPLCLCGAPATVASKIARGISLPMCQRCAFVGQIGVGLLKRFL